MRGWPLPVPAIERFWPKVDVRGPDDCWHWTAYCSPAGYGRIKFNGTQRMAHRVAYELFVGPIPEGLFIDHTCHNADASCAGGFACLHRRCVNPAHLEPVTNAENQRRGLVNQSKHVTHCPAGHPYSGENLRICANGDRQCVTCRRKQDRERKQRMRDEQRCAA